MSVAVQSPPETQEYQEYIPGLEARRRLKCGYSSVIRAALLGQIRTEILPGLSPRYNSADVDRLAESRRSRSAS